MQSERYRSFNCSGQSVAVVDECFFQSNQFVTDRNGLICDRQTFVTSLRVCQDFAETHPTAKHSAVFITRISWETTFSRCCYCYCCYCCCCSRDLPLSCETNSTSIPVNSCRGRAQRSSRPKVSPAIEEDQKIMASGEDVYATVGSFAHRLSTN